MTEIFERLLRNGLNHFSMILNDHQLNQFYDYYELLIHWNERMNLTTITELEDVIAKHFIDSLSLVKVVFDIGDNDSTLIDVGTGAGFPGIPLKITFPKVKVTLLDSLKKRVGFLDEVIDKLDLEGIEAIHGRAEDLGRDGRYRERYDYCVSRAVANLSTLSEYCLPFVKVNGFFIPYKSGKVEEEIKGSVIALHKLNGEMIKDVHFELPDREGDRSLLLIKKKGAMSLKYPRKAGLPSKEPL